MRDGRLADGILNEWNKKRQTRITLSTVIAAALAAALATAQEKAGSSSSFDLPRVGAVGTWEAESAQRLGEWRVVQRPEASGGAFVRPASAGGAAGLEFVVETSQLTNLRVWPEFWRHGDRRPPRRFPYPLPPRPGPNALDWITRDGQTYLVMTAPETGRVAVFDPRANRVTQVASIGGYPSDLVADRASGRLYVADAIGNRVVVLAANSLDKVAEFPAGPCPWSLSLSADAKALYVGCLKGKKSVALRTDTGQVVAETTLPAEATHVAASTATPSQLTAWMLPAVFDLETAEPLATDRELYGFGRRTSAEGGPVRQPGWKRFAVPRPHALRVEAFDGKQWATQEVDVRAVTEGPRTTATLPPPLRDVAGPDVMVCVGSNLFFTAPNTGRVGVFDFTKGAVVKTINVGGYVSDIAADGASGRVFVADALGDRIVVLSATELQVQKEIKIGVRPVSLEVFVPPPFLRSAKSYLLTACWAGKAVVRLDLQSLKVVNEWTVPSEPAMVKGIAPPDPGWWPLLTADRILLEQRSRVAVALAPKAFDAATLAPIPSSLLNLDFTGHNTVTMSGAGGAQTTYRVDNSHTVEIVQRSAAGVVTQKWADVTQVTDLQQMASPPPLTGLDDPGPLTLAADGGADQPWHRGVWMTPDQEQLLVYGTAEFWRWNAPVFSLAPGRHTIRLKVRSSFAQLDALRVERTLDGLLKVEVAGGGQGTADVAALFGDRYRSVFYDQEPVGFEVKLRNESPSPQKVEMAFEVTNYLKRSVAEATQPVEVGPSQTATVPLHFDLQDSGTFALKLVLRSEVGTTEKVHYFLRMPRLERPRMLLRKEEIAAVEARVKQRRQLYECYFAWLQRQCERKGFLPEGVASDIFGPKFPDAQKALPNAGKWRRYELAWRMFAVALGGLFAPEESQRDYFSAKLTELLKDGRTDYYCAFHHHGPFLPGAVAVLTDLAAVNPKVDPKVVAQMQAFFAKYMGDMNVFTWMLEVMDEPMDSKQRALLWHIAMWLLNVERYFDFHMGEHGGQRWLNPRTWCRCPYAGYGYSFLYLRNWLKEPEFQSKKLVSGFLTHSELIHPMRDNRGMLGAVGPNGEPLKWLDSILSRHPFLKRKYNWENLLKKLGSASITDAEVDQLLAYKEAAQPDEPMAFVVPLGLALGWYDPSLPEVALKEVPPTAFFDVEGDAVMRSGWDEAATEVIFTCGIRDHVYRSQPTHLQIARAGDFLLGTASPWGDDGNPNPGKSWGNIVIIEPSQWAKRWGDNFWHPRAEEYCLVNRFSDSTFRYITRNRRMTNYGPAEGGFGGGLDLHGHTESLLMQEGKMLAFETWPDFDYAAGDATNSWPVDLAEEVLRQVVFLKPNTVVVYDRVELGPKAQNTFWLAATGERLQTDQGRFSVQTAGSVLDGCVVQPTTSELQVVDPMIQGTYSTPPPYSTNWFLFDPSTRHQKVLEIHPGTTGNAGQAEYLVVMRTGAAPRSFVVLPTGSDQWRFSTKYPTSTPPPDSNGRQWFEPDYDDATWDMGKAPFELRLGGAPKPATNLVDNDGSYFFRKAFKASGVAAGSALELRVVSDDAAEITLNGTLIDRDPVFGKAPGHERARWNRWVSVDPSLLHKGRNVIAVQLCNDAKSPSAFLEVELLTARSREPLLPQAESVLKEEQAGVRWTDSRAHKSVEVLFQRTGRPGGKITITSRGRTLSRDFAQQVESTYEHWSSDPRFGKWVKDPRFSWIIPERDRQLSAKPGKNETARGASVVERPKGP